MSESSSDNPYGDWSDEQLLADCQVETRRGSGPGGQHRNKVESAVRLAHEPTGIVVTASERRSQARNRELALERLRERLERHFHRDPPRLATAKPRAVRKREQQARQRHSEKKRLRAPPRQDD